MRVADALARMLTALLGLVLLAGVALNFTNAFMRYVLGTSLRWGEEVMVFGLVFIVAGGLVVTTLAGEHLKVELLHGRAAAVMRVVSNLVLSAVFVYLAIQSQAVVSMMVRFGQQSVAARVPMWIPHGFLLVAFALGALAALVATVREVRRLRAPPDEGEAPS